jgi:PAS domain S-box-containing protein
VSRAPRSRQVLEHLVQELTERLRESEDTLAAIRAGDVDAIVVSGKRGEQIFSLAGSDSVYRLIVESMQEAALTATPEGRILFVNGVFCEMLGIPMEEAVGRSLADLVAPGDHPALAAILGVSEGKPVRARLSLTGTLRAVPAQVSVSFLPQKDGACICIVATDLSEIEAAAAELRRSNAELKRSATQLKSLAGELVRVEQRERRRLASILHDELQQILVGARFWMEKLQEKSGETLGPEVQGVIELLDQGIGVSRSLASEISPPLRSGSGLVDSLRWLAQAMERRHSLAVRVSVEGPVDPAGEDLSILLFRSVQELLFNVVKHSGVQAADLVLRAHGDELRITVSDRGRGFDVESVAGGADPESFGLSSIRDRLGFMGGRMVMASQPGGGSTFTLVVPLDFLRPVGGTAAAGAGPSPSAHGGSGGGAAPDGDGPPGKAPIRVMIVDDHRASREGMVGMLGGEADIRVVGACTDGDSAIREAGELAPDVILMDMSMPGMSGVEAARAIHQSHPEIRIVGISMFDEAAAAAEMKAAGAVAHILKSAPPRLLAQAIRNLFGSPLRAPDTRR